MVKQLDLRPEPVTRLELTVLYFGTASRVSGVDTQYRASPLELISLYLSFSLTGTLRESNFTEGSDSGTKLVLN